MTSVGVTGHQMRDGVDWAWVRSEIAIALAAEGGANELWTSLATGADTIAAQEALNLDWQIRPVIPHAEYEDVFSEEDRKVYHRLLARSAKVVQLASDGDDEAAYLAAGLWVADASDLLLIVWDGRPAAGKGGTGDIAAYASDRGKRTIWIDTSTSRTRPLSEAELPRS